jgi:hypothetical protein
MCSSIMPLSSMAYRRSGNAVSSLARDATMLLRVVVLVGGKVGNTVVGFPPLDHGALDRCLPRVVLPGEEVARETLALVLSLEAHNKREVVDAMVYLHC